jgi:hypothetical protein
MPWARYGQEVGQFLQLSPSIHTAGNGKQPQRTRTMNTQLTTRIARTASSFAAAALITFTGLHLIASYALPAQSLPGPVILAAAATTTPAR